MEESGRRRARKIAHGGSRPSGVAPTGERRSLLAHAERKLVVEGGPARETPARKTGWELAE